MILLNLPLILGHRMSYWYGRRLCVDYRAVNAVTYKDSYPLPHMFGIDGRCSVLFDVGSGYHNIAIKEIRDR
jgi:hypothetical protein